MTRPAEDDMDERSRPRRDGDGTTVTAERPPRSPDALLRDAWGIRRLLDDLDPEEHELRIQLVIARDRLRLEAAQQWHDRGWRPITDAF